MRNKKIFTIRCNAWLTPLEITGRPAETIPVEPVTPEISKQRWPGQPVTLRAYSTTDKAYRKISRGFEETLQGIEKSSPFKIKTLTKVKKYSTNANIFPWPTRKRCRPSGNLSAASGNLSAASGNLSAASENLCAGSEKLSWP